MEYSSEDSFVWTDTSTDGNSMSPDDNNIIISEQMSKTNGSVKKTKKEKKVSRNNSIENSKEIDKEVKIPTELGKSAGLKRKMIKLEPESDVDIPKKKKKKKQHSISIDHEPQENLTNDDIYLNMKVEEEKNLLSSLKPKVKKKKHLSIIDTDNLPHDDSYLNMKVKEEETLLSSLNESKKKRKHSPSNNTDNSSNDNSYLNMKVKEEESMVSPHKPPKKKNKDSTISEIDKSSSFLKRFEEQKVYSNMDIMEDNLYNRQETPDEVISKTKKKKKKSQNSVDGESTEASQSIQDRLQYQNIEINKNNVKDKEAKYNKIDSFVRDSEESVCEEISVIKGDEDHNLHSTLFSNSLIEAIPNVDSPNLCETQSHRKLRISDRIVFEDDDSPTETANINYDVCGDIEKSTNVKQYLKENSNLKQVTQNLHSDSVLCEDDNICILKCPKEIDVKAFKGLSFNLNGKSKIKVSGQTYEGSALSEAPDSVVVMTMNHNQLAISNMPLNAIVQLRRRIPKPHFRDDNIIVNNQTNFIPLPETKCRHPLFGSHYKKALKLPKAVLERLNAHEMETRNIVKHKKKQKKKDKHNSDSIQPNTVNESMTALKLEPEISLVGKEKKKKKRKHETEDGAVLNLNTHSKVKRIKNDPDSAEAWESEKAIEQNLFNF